MYASAGALGAIITTALYMSIVFRPQKNRAKRKSYLKNALALGVILVVEMAVAAPVLMGSSRPYGHYYNNAHSTLSRLSLLQEEHRADNGYYAEGFGQLALKGDGGVYTLYLGSDMLAPEYATAAALPEGLVPRADKEAFVAYAVANLDADSELDVWSLNSEGKIEQIRADPFTRPGELVVTGYLAAAPLMIMLCVIAIYRHNRRAGSLMIG